MPQDDSANQIARPISESEDIGPFRLASPIEIGFVLRFLAQRADFVTISFNAGRDLLLTRILDASVRSKQFIFDLSGNPASNQALQKAEKAVFIALPDGVKIQFSTAHIREVVHEGRPAFAAPFPPDLIKLQRREFFRLQTPLSNPYFCRFSLDDANPVRLELHDISLGGAAMWLPEIYAKHLEIGLKLRQLMFDFGPGGVMRLDAEVRHYRPVVNRQGLTQYIVGVRFCNMSRTQEASLQKLISLLERERKALID